MNKLKTLGLALIAALALTAIAVGPAQAASHGRAHPHRKAHHRGPAAQSGGAAKLTAASGDVGAQSAAGTSDSSAASIARIGAGSGTVRIITGTVVAMQTGSWQHGADDADCQVDVDTANMWQQRGDDLAGSGDQAGATKAYDNASTIAGEANAGGCNIFLNDNAD